MTLEYTQSFPASTAGQPVSTPLDNLIPEEGTLLDLFASQALQPLMNAVDTFAPGSAAYIADMAYAQAIELVRARRACHARHHIED